MPRIDLRSFPALSAGQRRADHGGCEKCGLERFHGSVIHKGDSLSGLALIPFAVNREGVFDGQGLL